MPRRIRAAGEVVLFSLLAFSPWPFASNDPRFEAILACGVFVLASLWALHAALSLRATVHWDAVTISFLGLIAWTAFQLLPLPEFLVKIVSPTRVAWHHAYLPANAELLPGEREPVARSSFLPLTIDPSATQTLLTQLVQIWLVYFLCRNWLASWAALRRLAWVLAGLGSLVAILGIVHLLTAGNGYIYWTIPVNGAVYAPFVCRNHFPDFVGLCMGVSVGLLFPTREKNQPLDRTQNFLSNVLTPRGLGLVSALGLMGVSIGFSNSRGGILSAFGGIIAVGGLALKYRPREAVWTSGLVIGAGIVSVMMVLVSWLGIDGILQRLATLSSQDPVGGRGDLWTDSAKLAKSFWLTGTGGGTYIWAEPVVRSTRSPMDVVDHAHNEYLEAVVEGGLIRGALTVALPIVLLISLVRGYIQRRERSVSPFLLGMLAALIAVALHAIGEFSLHMPAVALLAAAATGFAMAAANDAEFAPPAVRRKRKSTVSADESPATPDDAPATEPAPAPDPRHRWEGGRCLVAGLAIVLVAGLATRDSIIRERAYRWNLAADWVYSEQKRGDRLAERVRYLDQAVAYRPHDPQLLFFAAQARIDWAAALAQQSQTANAPASGIPIDLFPPAVVSEQIVPALKLLRAARQANPIAPKPHTRLGLYAEAFQQSERSFAHFDRAKQLLPRDPDLWFASGKLAYDRRDWTRAWGDWRKSLELSPRHLDAVLQLSDEVLFGWQILSAVLPEQPEMVLKAAAKLYSDPEDAKDRRLFLLAAIAYANRAGDSAPAIAATARAYEELQDRPAAGRAWRNALEFAPEDPAIREGLANWLEAEELYAEALIHLAWLGKRNPESVPLQDRIEAASRGQLIHDALNKKDGGNR